MPAAKPTRSIVVVTLAIALLCLGGAALWYLYATEDVNPYPMKDYNAATQQKAAEAVVAGLNTHNPDNVDLMRIDGQPESDANLKAITANITPTLPPPGCQYALNGVEDKGEQDPADVPWYHPSQARGFDMKLQQLCPGQPPTPRTIRVIAIPSGMGGYWAEAALRDETQR
ncbi:hypothetical protein FHT40_001322 [Mycolicibacterium sp. BK556]|uniref:hypothetical protein n=1 Tax=unclassified Mycolicibacterium TaxID=2636767 RepID=UPI001612B500|nr:MULTISPECIES: hypothetical protein [unclassified Mycolicibacterium]MBB3601689.1 hypothetical protein [Mycolicibacterium sp. BK556]MBB3631441.1 hypothetical protein [Mycolicibacterium sp. BK607]